MKKLRRGMWFRGIVNVSSEKSSSLEGWEGSSGCVEKGDEFWPGYEGCGVEGKDSQAIADSRGGLGMIWRHRGRERSVANARGM